MKDTLAEKIRTVLQELGAGGKEVIIQEAAPHPLLDMVFDIDKRPLYNTLCDMMKTGEVERIRPGVYKYIGRIKSPEMQEIMWKILRARKSLSVEDLQEISGASENYTKEWLQMLARRKIVRKNKNSTYTMIKDPVLLPLNEEKAAKLRRLRKEKKAAALAAVDRVASGVLGSVPMDALMHDAMEARVAIAEIPEG